MHFVNAWLNFGENLPSINLPTATKINVKVFIKKYWFPGTLNADTFIVFWPGEYYCHLPPVHYIPLVIFHFKSSKCAD